MTSPVLPPAARRSTFGRRDWLILGGIAALALALLVALVVARQAPASDARIVGCTYNADARSLEASVGITNRGRTSSDYLISVAFTNADGKLQYGTGSSVVRALEPGQSALPLVRTPVAAPPPGADFTCRLAGVRRDR